MDRHYRKQEKVNPIIKEGLKSESLKKSVKNEKPKLNVKIYKEDYEKLKRMCEHNSKIYEELDDLSKAKVWKIIGKGVDYQLGLLLKKERDNKSNGEVVMADDPEYDDDVAIVESDIDLQSDYELESSNSLSKTSSFVSSLKQRTSSVQQSRPSLSLINEKKKTWQRTTPKPKMMTYREKSCYLTLRRICA